MSETTSMKQGYDKPVLVKLENIKHITLECPDWQCSVAVPGPPA